MKRTYDPRPLCDACFCLFVPTLTNPPCVPAPVCLWCECDHSAPAMRQHLREAAVEMCAPHHTNTHTHSEKQMLFQLRGSCLDFDFSRMLLLLLNLSVLSPCSLIQNVVNARLDRGEEFLLKHFNSHRLHLLPYRSCLYCHC